MLISFHQYNPNLLEQVAIERPHVLCTLGHILKYAALFLLPIDKTLSCV